MSVPITGQLTVTGTAQPLSATAQTATGFVIKAPATNTAAIFIGPAGVTTANGFAIDPGDSFEYQRSNVNGEPTFQLLLSDFYVIGTGGSVSWLASP